jgi:large subunit ribosomal protein L29
MKTKEIREKDTPALVVELKGQRVKLFELRSQLSIQKVDDTSQARVIRRDIARLMTILTERRKAFVKSAEKTK